MVKDEREWEHKGGEGKGRDVERDDKKRGGGVRLEE